MGQISADQRRDQPYGARSAAPPGQKALYFGPDAKFGLLGSITTKEACEAAGGEFHTHIFGWMVHVYPNETDPAKDLVRR